MLRKFEIETHKVQEPWRVWNDNMNDAESETYSY